MRRQDARFLREISGFVDQIRLKSAQYASGSYVIHMCVSPSGGDHIRSSKYDGSVPAGVDVLIIIIIIVIPASSLLSSYVYYEIERDRR